VRSFIRPRRLSTRLVVPFCVLVGFLSVAGTWFLTRQTIGSLEERSLAQLADATTRAQLVVGDAEAEALNTVNRLAFTKGLADSVAASDVQDTVAAAAAVIATSGMRRVSVAAVEPTAAEGFRVLVDVDRERGTEPGAWSGDEAALGAVQGQLQRMGGLRAVLSGTVDATGDKYAALVPAEGPVPAGLAVAAPLRRATQEGGDEIVGAVIVVRPLSDVVSDLRARLGVDAAVVAPDGTVLASTFGEDGPFVLGPEAVTEAMTGRRAATAAQWQGGGYTVSAGPLDLRGQTRGVVAAALPDTPVRKSVAATRLQVLLLFAGGLVGVLLIGMGISRRIARNVNELATAADAVASGDFDRRVELRSDDELGVLSTAFNNMARRLAAYRESQEEVISRLRDVDRAKDELIDNISHELRTPLTPIKGSARILSRADLDEDTRRQMADMVAHNSDRLLEVVNRLIAASSSAAGRGEPPRNPVDVSAVAHAVVTRRVPADQRERVRVATAFGVPRAAGDEGAIGQIVFDLLDNALKFSDETVEVDLSTDDDAATVEIEVRDTGIGVSEADRERMFERFYQADGSSTRCHGGLGLGLAVVGGLVAWMGGEVSVTDGPGGGEGPGTTVRVVLPATAESENVEMGTPGGRSSLGFAVQRVAAQPG